MAHRQIENAESPPEKRPRSESSSAHENPSIEMVDLNSLDLQSLLNVTFSNELLRSAANAVYKRKFSTKINLFRVHGIQKSIPPFEDKGFVIIYNFETCLDFLRCFGASITHLKISYGQSISDRYDFVHQHINKYCAETLTTIQFDGTPPMQIKYFDEPFVNVRNVDIEDCDLGDQFQQIFTWFPNHSHLNVRDDVVNRPFPIVSPPPDLKHLVIKFNTRVCDELFKRYRSIVNRLQLNHQLADLTIKAKAIKMTMNFLLDVIKNCPFICKLVVDTAGCTSVKKSEVVRLVLEHPTLSELDLSFYRFTAANVNIVIRRLTSLKQFRFGVQHKKVYMKMEPNLGREWESAYGGTCATLNRCN